MIDLKSDAKRVSVADSGSASMRMGCVRAFVKRAVKGYILCNSSLL